LPRELILIVAPIIFSDPRVREITRVIVEEKVIVRTNTVRGKTFLLAFAFFVSIFGNQLAFAQTEAPASGETETLAPVPAEPNPTEPQPAAPSQAPTEPQTGSPSVLQLDPGSGTTQRILENLSTDRFVKRNPVLVRFYDAGISSRGNTSPDGDAITVTLQNASGSRIIANNIVLGPGDATVPVVEGQLNTYAITLGPGINSIYVRATSLGTLLPSASVGMVFALGTSFKPGTNLEPETRQSVCARELFSIIPGQNGNSDFCSLSFYQVETASLNAPKPQDAVIRNIRNARVDPALRNPSNPNDLSRVLLCTKDSPGSSRRRGASQKKALDEGKVTRQTGFELDEYPPALCTQNEGTAHVEAVPEEQNSSAGGTLSGGSRKFEDGDTFELRIGPMEPQ
jgi:Deoxyribonuclease NucA/NucB